MENSNSIYAGQHSMVTMLSRICFLSVQTFGNET